MDLMNLMLNLVVPPAGMVTLAFAWPTLALLRACGWLYRTVYMEDMDDKVVLITGASSGIGEKVAYEYAAMGANLVLVARRESRLRSIRENCMLLGARQVLIMATDVVKEDDCKRFIGDTITYFGRLDHLVNTVSLGHTFYFEEALDTTVFPHVMDINFWGNVYPTYAALPYLRLSRGRIVVSASVEDWLPMPRMSIYVAAKAGLINFYETLRHELKDNVGVTIATHGWIGTDMSRGRLMLEEGAEMQWKEETEVYTNGDIEEYARAMTVGACRGDECVKYPRWYDNIMSYGVFIPDVLAWTFQSLLPTLAGLSVNQLLL